MRFSACAQSVMLGVTPAHECNTMIAGVRPPPAGNERSPVTVPGCSTAPGRVGNVLVRMGNVPTRPSASVATPLDIAHPASNAESRPTPRRLRSPLDSTRALDEGAQAKARARAIEIFHAAVGRCDEALGRNVTERRAQAGRDDVGRLGRRSAEVEDAENDRLRADRAERREVEARLRGL